MFDDREDAGRRLVPALRELRPQDPIVFALPRGGVPVARPISQAIDAPLDVLVVRKLGVPRQPELAMGAIGRGVQVLDDRILDQTGVGKREIERVVKKERAELERRDRLYRRDAPFPKLDGRSVVLVDDGIATGSTAMAAIEVLRAQGASRIVLAVPVLPPSAVARFQRAVDDLVYLEAPRDFYAVGQFYADFGQTTDQEVQEALAASRRETREATH